MVLINLDRLYEETLYDFSGCFKQWALNYYLKARFADKTKYWEIEDPVQFNKIRHTFPEGTTVLSQAAVYQEYCAQLLFTPKDHQDFYETLIQIGRVYENKHKGPEPRFSRNRGKPA